MRVFSLSLHLMVCLANPFLSGMSLSGLPLFFFTLQDTLTLPYFSLFIAPVIVLPRADLSAGSSRERVSAISEDVLRDFESSWWTAAREVTRGNADRNGVAPAEENVAAGCTV